MPWSPIFEHDRGYNWLDMNSRKKPVVIEGLWDEIQSRSAELRGKRVSISVLDDDKPLTPKESAYGALSDIIGSWEGDDLDECLALVYKTRTLAGE